MTHSLAAPVNTATEPILVGLTIGAVVVWPRDEQRIDGPVDAADHLMLASREREPGTHTRQPRVGEVLGLPRVEIEGGHHPDRDDQFSYPDDQASEHLAAGDPVISVDPVTP